MLIAQHAEEPRLTVGAVAHEGPNAARLGLAGWPRAAEESIVARDALLARDAGARVHICHASTAGTVEILKWAKQQGISITAEVTPHHLLLDDSRLATYDGVNRVNPPLREASDAAGAAAGPGRRGDRLRGHRSRPARRAREVLRVLRRPARACSGCRPRCRWWSQTMVATGPAGLARCRPGDEREPGPHRRSRRPGPPAGGRRAGQPGGRRPRRDVDRRRRRPGQPLGQHPVRGDDVARHGHRHAAARHGDRAGREEPGG